MTKTRDEVEALKAEWIRNPAAIGDLENTAGFEDYRSALRVWRREMENVRAGQLDAALMQAANQMGTDNLVLAAYLLKLEARVAKLEVLASTTVPK